MRTPYSYQPLSYGTTSDDAKWAGVASYLRREREKMEAEEKADWYVQKWLSLGGGDRVSFDE